MFRAFTGLTVSLALFASLGCTADGGADVERPYSRCSGGCDAPGSLPELAAIDLDALAVCTAAIDTSSTDDFFANDRLACRLTPPTIRGASLSVSITVRNADGVYREAYLRTGAESASLGSLPRTGYPFDLTATVRFGLPGDVTSELPITVTIFSFDEYRDLEVAPLVLGLPVSVLPVRVWPDSAVQETWTADLRAISVTSNASVSLGPDASLTSRARKTASASRMAIEELPDELALFIPAFIGGAGTATASVTMHTRSAGSAATESVIDGAGYWLLGADGSLTRSAIEDLPLLAGYAGYGTPEPTSPDPEPVAVPDEPCAGTCRSDEVCVAGACLERRLQAHDASACGSTSTALCDAGEDADCADLHVCIDGRCTNIVCQRQVFPACPPPSAPCEDPTDCYPGHECAAGLCTLPEC